MPRIKYVRSEKGYDEAKLRKVRRGLRGMSKDFGKIPQQPAPVANEIHVTFH